MATYADFITKLRSDVGDFPLRRFETADGDALTSVFNLQHPKILESSYTYKVGGVTQTEGAGGNYTQDKDVAQVIFNNGSIPGTGNDNVSFEYKSVNQLDADWIDIINQVLSDLRKKLWKEVVDESTLVTVADQSDYATSGVAADIVYLFDLEYRSNSTRPWSKVNSVSNVKFYKDLQKIHLKPTFDISDYAIRIRVARAFVQGTTTGATFEPQERYWDAIRAFCKVKYLERQMYAMMKETGAVSKEKSFENINDFARLINTAQDYAEKVLKRVSPQKPAMDIPHVVAGGNA